MTPDSRRHHFRGGLSALVSSLLLVTALAGPAHPGEVKAHAAGFATPSLKVAIVRSQATIDWIARHALGYDHAGKSDAAYAYLSDRGWDVTRIGDADLDDLSTLRLYDVIVLPYVFAMDPLASQTMVQYVAGGGGLVSALGSPRIAPSYDVSPDEVWSEHWVHIMNYEGWEWGPLSEVYQTYFVDDNFTPRFDVHSSSHQIAEMAGRIVSDRGFSPESMDLVRDPGAGLELVTLLQNNSNAEPFATFAIRDAGVSGRYPLRYPAGVASEYLDGRSVYFYFSPMDFLPTYHRWLSDELTSAGTPQGEVAGAYLEAALIWAATDDGVSGAINRDGRTRGTVDVYQDGIYTHQYLTNEGNVSASGTLSYTIWDPRGFEVASWTRYMTGVAPGTQQRYSHQYNPGRLEDGEYRVQVRYVFTYPHYRQSWTEEVRVRRGGGTGIATSVTEIVADPLLDGSSPHVPGVAASRYETAVKASQEAYPDGASTAIIATGRNWPDALGGSALAGALDGPILLVTNSAVPEIVFEEVVRLGATSAVIVGGEAAVGPGVADALQSADLRVERVAGGNRYETAERVALRVIAELGDAYDGTAFVATGVGYADAVAAGPIAASQGWPLFLSHPTRGIRHATLASMADVDSVLLLGGTTAIPEEVADSLRESFEVTRLAGATRYATAVAVAEHGIRNAGLGWGRVGIATGQAYPDALAGGVLQSKVGSVLLLTRSDSLAPETAETLLENKADIGIVTYFGGDLAVSPAVREAVSRVLQ